MLQREFKSLIIIGFTSYSSYLAKQVSISIDNAIHDFLFALQESSDMNNEVKVIVDGQNVGQLSDGLYGEPYTEDGWYSKYSSFGENGNM